jgi:hypothetical protein
MRRSGRKGARRTPPDEIGRPYLVRLTSIRRFVAYRSCTGHSFGEYWTSVPGGFLAISNSIMARIRRSGRRDVLRLSVTGRLTAADMRRLEHACARALSDPAIGLEIDARQVTHLDPTARAVLHSMAKRGARIFQPADETAVRSIGDHTRTTRRSTSRR